MSRPERGGGGQPLRAFINIGPNRLGIGNLDNALTRDHNGLPHARKRTHSTHTPTILLLLLLLSCYCSVLHARTY